MSSDFFKPDQIIAKTIMARAYQSTRKFLPDLFELRSLFPKQPQSNIFDDDPGSDKQQNAVEDTGFPEGSTILISGPPGSGKSTFALAFMRSLIRLSDSMDEFDAKASRDRPWMIPSESWVKESIKNRILISKARIYYISTEATHARLQRAFADMGWFEDADPVFGANTGILRLIVPKMDIERPAKKSEDIVNEIFNRIRADLMADAPEGLYPFVVVDSLTALLKDCRDRGEERRQTHEFIRRLDTVFRENLHVKETTDGGRAALTLFISEENSGFQPVVPVEDYVVDVVFRLYLKDVGFGRRLRAMEMLKSHGAFLSSGEHTWAILAKNGCRFVIYQEDLQREIERQARRKNVTLPEAPAKEEGIPTADKLEPDFSCWGTIAIFPRLVLAPAPELPAGGVSASYDEEKMVQSGIPGLDEMLKNDADYWAHDESIQNRIGGTGEVRKKSGLLPGSTSLILGGAGTGKTTMCMQFLLAEKITGQKPEHPEEKSALYVNFENNFEEVIKRYPDTTISESDFAHCAKVYRRRGSLDVNLLFAEIRWIIRNRKNHIRRVALDGLSSLLVTIEPTQYAILVEGLLQSIHLAARNRSEDIKNEAFGKAHKLIKALKQAEEQAQLDAIARGMAVELKEALRVAQNAEEKSREFFKKAGRQTQSKESEYEGIGDEAEKLAVAITAVDKVKRLASSLAEICEKNAHLTKVIREFEKAAAMVPNTDRVAVALRKLAQVSQMEEMRRDLAMARGEIASFWNDSITIFITYEVDTQITYELDAKQMLDTVSQLSATADNVMKLQRVSVNDTLFTAITIPKARNLEHDRSVRQVRIDKVRQQDEPEIGTKRVPLVIERGLEGFSGVMEGKPKPVEVVLQLFSENDPERHFNIELSERLGDAFDYELKTRGFSGNDITSALRDAVDTTSRFPAADLKILSVDEWWIHEHYPAERHPLLKLSAFEHQTAGSQVGTHQSDFWSWEIDKVMQVKHKSKPGSPQPEVEGALLAVPSYMDFGMFCLNARFAAETSSEAGPGGAEADRDSGSWADLVDAVPRHWVAADGDGWFAPPDGPDNADTIVGFMKRRQRLGGWGFVYDMRVRETAICAYLEFVWSFGAGEKFLMELAGEWLELNGSPLGGEPDTGAWGKLLQSHPAVTATRFLMYLVYHGLMPWRAKISDVPEAVFSRHFYSTFIQRCVEEKRADPPKVQPPDADTGPLDLRRLWEGESAFHLKPVPFFPAGIAPTPGCLDTHFSAFQSVWKGFSRLIRRVDDALILRNGGSQRKRWKMLTALYLKGNFSVKTAKLFAEDALGHLFEMRPRLKKLLQSSGGSGMPSLAVALKRMRRDADNLRRFAWKQPDLVPGATIRQVQAVDAVKRSTFGDSFAMDLRDIDELIECHLLRCRMLETALEVVPEAADRERQSEPLEVAASRGSAGHSCAGSWSVGVLNSTHSPVLSSKIIEEITSLATAQHRVKLGAGFPARKDFYEYYGNDPVPGAPYLTWQELFRMCKSRARRRDRALCPLVPTSRTFDLIHRKIMAALAKAEECRKAAQSGKREGVHLVAEMKETAVQTVSDIIEGIGAEIVQIARSGRHISCPCRQCATQAEARRRRAQVSSGTSAAPSPKESPAT